MLKYLVPLAAILAMPGAHATLQPQKPAPEPAPMVAPAPPADPLAAAPRISVADARKALDAGTAVLVDVRGLDTCKEEHAKGALCIPAGDLYARAGEIPKDKQIIAYCT